MSWVLFIIATGFALYYRYLYQQAEDSVTFWVNNSEEWKKEIPRSSERSH